MEKERQIVLSDTHFGVKNNSLMWLKSQMSFFYDTVLPLANKIKSDGDRVTLVHLGDLFDSRSSINPMVYDKVCILLKDLSDVVDETILVAGNHDYYSPIESDRNVNSLSMLPDFDNIHVVNDSFYSVENNVFIPWFNFHNSATLEKILAESKFDTIWTHTDCEHMEEHTRDIVGDRKIVTGHIHTPSFTNKFFTIGSCYPLTFIDADQNRGLYLVESWDIEHMLFVPNESSIKFYRVYGKEVFDYTARDNHDYVELWVSKSDFNDSNFKKAISRLNKECTLSVRVLPNDEIDHVEIGELDIVSICRKTVPDGLLDKFDKISVI